MSGKFSLKTLEDFFVIVQSKFISWFAALSLTTTKNAFTLAEVLITLGVIGVVASLTIPQLVANHRKRIVETRIEHFYSLMNQAVIMSENEHGMFDDWVFPPSAYNADEMEVFYNEYFKSYVKTIKTEKKNGILYVYLADSSMFKVFNHNPKSKLLHLYFYPMGRERNNVMGQDNFTFLIWTGNKGNKVEPYKFSWSGTRDQLLNTGQYACKNHNHYCAALIQYDNWKISDDYPFRF